MDRPDAVFDVWPDIALKDWEETCATLHMWVQIVGKVRLVQSPWVNHSWTATLYVTARGLTTSPIPHGNRLFEIELDFITHRLTVRTGDGDTGGFALESQSVATFYAKLMNELSRLNLPVTIRTMPNEVIDAVPFDRDEVHDSYDPVYANRYWRAMAQADRVFKEFRARFVGKCSPVHYFWGAPDLAVTRFSGRTAPKHPGGVPNMPDWVAEEAYSHEVSSCGFWPGSGAVPYPAFYSYAYPEPPGFSEEPVRPAGAFYSTDFAEFILPYDVVRQSSDPDGTLLEFLQTTYEAAARLGDWDRASLERDRDPRDAADTARVVGR